MTIAVERTVEAGLSPLVAQALAFTEAYKKYCDAPLAVREAMCLKTQYPALMGAIRAGDVLVSRHAAARITYVGTMWWAPPPRKRNGQWSPTKQGGFCFDFELAEKAGKSEEERRVLAELSEFWKANCTWTRVQKVYDDEMRTYASGGGQISAGANGFCVCVNSDRLLQRGIPGLFADIAERRAAAERAGEDVSFYEGLRVALEVVVSVANHYRQQALDLATGATDAADAERLQGIAQTLEAITRRAPASFREAVQLFWLYTHLVSGNHPEAFRLDTALGDFMAADIDAGRISEEEAVELLVALWRMFSENGADALCRIVIGGLGRRNVANADRFCLAAMEATRRHRRVTPQLTLRFHEAQDSRLLKKAFDCIAEGCCYPMLYNDDVVVPGVMRAMHLPREAAECYYPLGCGENMVGWSSPSVLCCGWSIGKSLDAALHNGMSKGVRVGPESGAPETFDTYEKLYAAYMKQVAFSAEISARAYRKVFDEVPQDCSFLLGSLLTDDCLERGKGILQGSRHLGACVMGHGFSNAADALAAIRAVVYEQKRATLSEVVAALDADFVGHEALHKALCAAPKFGNDVDEVDQVLVKMWKDISAAADLAGERQRLDFHTVSSVNPGGYALGEDCPATADGRRAGQPFAIGHAPVAGRDTSGLTALFNSIAKADAANGGAVTNFKISRDLFTRSRPKLEAMFASYFENGGQEATVTCVNRGDLEAALEHPENYGHILVRLGGWCARFVTLERRIQEEIIRRTMY